MVKLIVNIDNINYTIDGRGTETTYKNDSLFNPNNCFSTGSKFFSTLLFFIFKSCNVDSILDNEPTNYL